MLGLMRVTGRTAGMERVRYVARTIVGGKPASDSIMRAVCDVAARMAERLDMSEGVRRGLAENLERWDGKGAPRKLRGEDIALASRIAEPATQAVIFHRLGGTDAALAMVERRAGSWFDPAIAEAFASVGPKTLERLDQEDPWAAVLEAEPEPVRRVALGAIDRVAEAFADMVDLKTPFTPGHSSEVASLAASAAGRLGLAADDLRRAALLHDLGRVAVSNAVWEKPGPLTAGEWEQVRLHAYRTERILDRVPALAPLGRIAGMHHERQDGTGYHRGSSGSEVGTAARVLAAADAFQAMTQDRVHRGALTAEQAAEQLRREARACALDSDCVAAVLEAAGQARPGRRRDLRPAGLSEREIEVLRFVAAGCSNPEIAKRLVISRRTAEHHVQHIYAKLRLSSRPALALFALEHDLI
jgi:HD-GYP domain-containing protein (c-di-GMP phosphodiesterase class II)